MNGELTGYVLEVHRQADGGQHVRLSGITHNGHTGIHWIHTVMFSASRAPQVKAGQIVRVNCMAAYRTFEGRDGNKASRVDIHGVRLMPCNGTLVERSGVRFLEGAVNAFRFTGYAVNPAVHKPQYGVTNLRLAVQGRAAMHYFECEGWREMAGYMRQFGKGAELAVIAILRRDHKEIKGVKCAFDVMEVQALSRVQLPRTALMQAAD